MNLFNLSSLIGVFTFLISYVFFDLIQHKRGYGGSLEKHYLYLKGDLTPKPGKSSTGKRSAAYTNMRQKMLRKGEYYYAIPICISIFMIAYASFKSMSMAFVLSAFGFFAPKAKQNNMKKKYRELIELQFRDALNSITASLKAGLSISSALIKCSDDLEKLYLSQKDKPMHAEFLKIKNDLNMGMSVDDALRSFNNRIRTEDVEDFVNSVIIVRVKGGNMVEVMNNVSQIITDKQSIKFEIERLTTGKRLESKMLTAMPILLIVSLSLFSPSYMEPLYGTLIGKFLIILGFSLLIINYFIGKKIIDIKV